MQPKANIMPSTSIVGQKQRVYNLKLASSPSRLLIYYLLILGQISTPYHDLGTVLNNCDLTPCVASNRGLVKHLFARALTINQEDAASAKQPRPHLILISPQSFKVPTNPLQNVDNHEENKSKQWQQYVAVINNAQSDEETQLVRERYKRLSLQVRDARQPRTGQLFYEHTFDYFSPDQREQHLLIPISLDQVSPKYEQIVASNADGLSNGQSGEPSADDWLNRQSYADKKKSSSHRRENSLDRIVVSKPQQLIISIRPHRERTNSWTPDDSTDIELVSSAPILVEPVPSRDGQRSFGIVQTDKPIYKPEDQVRIRALIVNENLRPVIDDEFKIQIRNPHRVVVEETRFPRPPGESGRASAQKISAKLEQPLGSAAIAQEPLFVDHLFEFPPEPMLGTWTVHLLHNDPVANASTHFELKEYVLPPYEISFELPRYVLPSTKMVVGHIFAKYHHGKPVQGKVQIKYGLKESLLSKPKYIARSGVKSIDASNGRVDFRIGVEKFKESGWFPSIAGSRLVVEATVTEDDTGHLESAQDVSCMFISKPYRFSFEQTIMNFKSEISQQLVVQLVDSLNQEPGPANQRVNATFVSFPSGRSSIPRADTWLSANKLAGLGATRSSQVVTDRLGRAVFSLGPVREPVDRIFVLFSASIEIGAKAADSEAAGDATAVELVSDWHTLDRHNSSEGWIDLMNKTVDSLKIGDQFVSDVLIRDAPNVDQVRKKIFYTLASRGNIIALGSLDSRGLISFRVTEQMVPAVRLVVFQAREPPAPPFSDSMRIDVSHAIECGLELDYKSAEFEAQTLAQVEASKLVRPNERGQLLISARPGDLVSLIGVDSATYSLNNRTRLGARHLVERIKRLDTGCGFGGGLSDLDAVHNAGLMLFSSSQASELQSNSSFGAHSFIGSACLSIANQLRYLDDARLGYSRPLFEHLRAPPSLAPGRKKRDLAPSADSILKRYKHPTHRACCRLGLLEDAPQQRNCSARSRIVQRYTQRPGQSAEMRTCAMIYEMCCHNVFGEQLRIATFSPVNELPFEARLYSILQVPQYSQETLPNIGFIDQVEAHTLIRSDFRETWLFELVAVPGDERAKLGKASLDVQLPHSITTWSVGAMALNRRAPMCLMRDQFKLTAYQHFFLQVSMPYKVVQGEQIDLVAKLFNYADELQDVLVYMYGVEGVCSDAEPGERSEQRRVRLAARASQSVLLPMIPVRTGKFNIKIVAISLSSNASDIVQRELKVVARGRPVSDETTFSLDPLNQQRRSKRAIQTGNLMDEIDSSRGIQHSRVRLAPSRDAELIVPQTEQCIVSAIGDKLGSATQTSIVDVENLIRLPHGCGEQVMIYLGPTLYTARYLSATDRLSGEARWRAIRYIQSGYKRVLNFRKPNGAFSAFAEREPSIWLTAFVAKLLCQTERAPFIANEVHVDRAVVDSALEWLIEQQNATSGEWLEQNPVYHREMLGGGALRQNLLTAFVTITLNECAHHAREPASEQQRRPQTLDALLAAARRAEQSLVRRRLEALDEKNAYVLALVAYALSRSWPHEASLALADLLALADKSHALNQLHWRGEHQIETAAYALQAVIETGPHVSLAGSSSANERLKASGANAIAITNWLSSRRSYSGAFESTQDTVVALEALAKFAQLQSSSSSAMLRAAGLTGGGAHNKLSCQVSVSNRSRRSIEFSESNAQILQTFKLDALELDPVSGEMLDITTSGSGVGTMSIKLKYNVFQEDDELCRFNINSFIDEWHPALAARDKTSTVEQSIDETGSRLGGESGWKAGQSAGEQSDRDELLRIFDQSMLGELNLVHVTTSLDPRRPDDETRRDEAAAPRSPEPSLPPEPGQQLGGPRLEARRRRSANESWTSKVVSSFKTKLHTWFVPDGPKLGEQRRNGTSRRSAQMQLAPLVGVAAGGAQQPSASQLNTLSETLEISTIQRAGANQSGQQQAATGSTLQAGLQTFAPSELAQRVVLLLRVCTTHLSRRDSEMAVVEVGVLSGFKPNEADLREIIGTPGTPAMKFELSPDRSLVIIYMQHIPSSGQYCLQFRLVRDSLVHNIQSGYIRVYEYYSPRHSCSSFYTPTRVSDLIKMNCDSSGQVCQCASKSLCPATSKLRDLGQISQLNAISAHKQLVDMICSKGFDLIALVRLKHVKLFESSKIFKLSVKVQQDFRGNLTKILQAQRKQREQSLISGLTSSEPVQPTEDQASGSDQLENSLDLLSLSIDSACLREDPLLLHLAHQNQWKQGGQLILFAKSHRIEKRLFRPTKRYGSSLAGSRAPIIGPRPKANVWTNDHAHPPLAGQQQADQTTPINFNEATQLQYSLHLQLDRETILHDQTYQAKVEPREAMNNLMVWLESSTRREALTCP